jgi:hypothetical protein
MIIERRPLCFTVVRPTCALAFPRPMEKRFFFIIFGWGNERRFKNKNRKFFYPGEAGTAWYLRRLPSSTVGYVRRTGYEIRRIESMFFFQPYST